MKTTQFLIPLLLTAAGLGATDPCTDKPTRESWVQCKLGATTGLVNPVPDAKAATSNNQQNPTKGAASPAIATSSTSLVDHTTLADFATAALNVAGFGSGSAGAGTTSQSPSVTTTISAYTIYSAIKGRDPMNAELYDTTPGWRKITFTVGTSNSSGSSTGSSSTSSQSTGSTESKVVGASFLLLNQRDLATKENKAKRNDVATELDAAGGVVTECVDEIEKLLGERFKISNWKSVMNSTPRLDEKEQQAMDAIFSSHRQEFQKHAKYISNFVSNIQKKPQLSISGQALIGSGAMATSDYRGQLAYEMGLPGNFNWTVNGSFDYINSPKIGADTRGARLATDLQYIFKRAGSTTSNALSPVSIDISGEGDWFQSYNPSYAGQFKLTIPIAKGVDFPMSVSYASKSTLLHEKNVVGKFGITFDLSKIASALTK